MSVSYVAIAILAFMSSILVAFFINFHDLIFPGYAYTLMPHNRYICKELIVLDWEQLGNDPENNDLWLD